jgi:hypothetical protein
MPRSAAEIMAPSLNAYEAPPSAIKEVFKKYQKIKPAELLADKDILDFSREPPPDSVQLDSVLAVDSLKAAFHTFLDGETALNESLVEVKVYSLKQLPGRSNLRCQSFSGELYCEHMERSNRYCRFWREGGVS